MMRLFSGLLEKPRLSVDHYPNLLRHLRSVANGPRRSDGRGGDARAYNLFERIPGPADGCGTG